MKSKILLIVLVVLAAAVWLNMPSMQSSKVNDTTPEKQTAPAIKTPSDEKIILTPESIKTSGIAVATAGPALLKTTVEFPGEIELNKKNLAHVVPRVAGVITQLRKNLGDKVKKDEIIAVLDSQGLAETKSQYIQSVHRLEFAQAKFVREEILWKKQISAKQDYLESRHQLEEAELARQVAEQRLLSIGLSHEDLAALAIEPEGTVKDREVRTPFPHKELTRYELKSPIEGTVIERQVALGETVKEDANLFIIADMSTVLAGLSIYAKDLNAVRIGQKVSVRAQALDMETSGTIFYIGPLVGAQTRTAKAYVSISNTKGLWRPGLFITADAIREEIKVPVAVPVEAVQTLNNKSSVFVQTATQFEPRSVELGRTDGKWMEIRSGLSAGETYASKNSFTLKADLGKSGAER